MEALIAQVVGGLVGGGISGKAVKAADLGNIGNLIAGAVGGLGGGALLNQVMEGGAAMGGASMGGIDIAALAGQFVGGGVGGAILQIIVGLIVNKVFKKQ
ncbi:hypothetical protein [Sneathiella sp.]|uniref:hypothetical protein n=1 Tax=Sneathiella sp. TaxID=1964365 RepID=UPI002FE2628B